MRAGTSCGEKFLLAGLLALWPIQAFAYFDPGSGTVLLQLLVAAGIGAVYRFRAWLARLVQLIKTLFRR